MSPAVAVTPLAKKKGKTSDANLPDSIAEPIPAAAVPAKPGRKGGKKGQATPPATAAIPVTSDAMTSVQKRGGPAKGQAKSRLSDPLPPALLATPKSPAKKSDPVVAAASGKKTPAAGKKAPSLGEKSPGPIKRARRI